MSNIRLYLFTKKAYYYSRLFLRINSTLSELISGIVVDKLIDFVFSFFAAPAVFFLNFPD